MESCQQAKWRMELLLRTQSLQTHELMNSVSIWKKIYIPLRYNRQGEAGKGHLWRNHKLLLAKLEVHADGCLQDESPLAVGFIEL